MRSSAQAARRPTSLDRGNRNHNTRAATDVQQNSAISENSVAPDDAEQEYSVAPTTHIIPGAFAPRNKHTCRFLFYTLSEEAKAVIKKLDQNSRYAEAEDLTIPFDEHHKVTGPLRPQEYHDYLRELQKQEGSGIQFQSMLQISRGRFVPAYCGDNDQLNVAAYQALATQA